MYRMSLALLMGLAGCTESRFEFRGWSDLSSCREVIDTELANGAEFESAYDSTDPESPGHITELDGRLFDIPVRIDISCTTRGRIAAVQYIARVSQPEDTAQALELIATELAPLFGDPWVSTTPDSRTLSYGCEEPAPVRLEEWRVTAGEDDDEVEHELYLAVVPGLMSCLGASVNSK